MGVLVDDEDALIALSRHHGNVHHAQAVASTIQSARVPIFDLRVYEGRLSDSRTVKRTFERVGVIPSVIKRRQSQHRRFMPVAKRLYAWQDKS